MNVRTCPWAAIIRMQHAEATRCQNAIGQTLLCLQIELVRSATSSMAVSYVHEPARLRLLPLLAILRIGSLCL